MRFKSRFTIIGILAAAALTLLTVVPAMADVATAVTLELETLDGPDGGTVDVGVSPSDFVSNDGAANNEVQVFVHDNDAGLVDLGDDDEIDVTISSNDDDIVVRIVESPSPDGGHFGGTSPFPGVFTVVTDEVAGAVTEASGSVVAPGSDTDDLIADVNDTSVDVDDGADFTVGMKLKIESEHLRVTAITDSGAPGTIAVLRAQDGTSVELHANADDDPILIVTSIFAPDDGDTIDVEYAVGGGATILKQTTVDGTGPDIDDILPEADTFQRAPVDLFANVDDIGVGLVDEDFVTANFIFSVVGIADLNPTTVTEKTSFDIVFDNLNLGEDIDGAYAFTVEGFDAVGNQTIEGPDDFTVDETGPEMVAVFTGWGWDSEDNKLKAGRDKLAVVFHNAAAAPDDDVPEFLLSSSLEASDFLVEGHDVIGLVFPNLKDDGEDDDDGGDLSALEVEIEALLAPIINVGVDGGLDDETRYMVFLTLEDDLASDEEPTVTLTAGNVEDLAGNDNSSHDIDATDKIGPAFTITIVGEASSRPIVIGEDDHDFTITISSDEDLEGDDPPDAFLLSLDLASDETDGAVGAPFVGTDKVQVAAVFTLSLDSVGTNTWEADLEGNDPFGGGFSGLAVVFVSGEDKDSNVSTSDGVDTVGALPAAGNDSAADDDTVDLSDAADDNALMEFDSDLAAPVFELRPESGTDETESRNPFVVFDFAEGTEYEIDINTGDLTAEGDLDGPFDKIDDTEIDSHDVVTLTSLTLEGADVLGQVGRVDDDSFVVALRDLAVGEYTLTCTAVDEVGNEIDADDCKFDFEVVERGDYEVPLDPGWNLVSLPGTPADTAIDSVLPSSMSASRVLQWAGGAFEVAERGDDGMWDPSGQITEITAGPGYWVFTTAFEDIETLIPERAPETVLPTVDIVGGWNLVGIVDLAQADAGAPPGDAGEVEASAYFASLTWTVAYSYDTTSGLWTRYTGSDDDDGVVNGKGYWIWATEAGTLVP